MKVVYAGSINGNGSISGKGKGIYTITLKDDYSIDQVDSIYSQNSGIITMNQDQGIIYATNEVRDFNGHRGIGGGVSCFSTQKNQLVKLNDSISYGSNPSYVTISEDHRYLALSNHGSHSSVIIHYVKNQNGEYTLENERDDSSIALFELLEDGSIGKLLDLKIFKGHGYWINGGQECSFLHSVKFKGDFLFACNRGCDEIEVMKIVDHQLVVVDRYATRKGLAPRHLDFHPTKNMIYVCNENYPCVSVYQYDENGKIQELQTIKSVPDFIIPYYTKEQCDLNEFNDTVMGGNRKMTMPSDIHIDEEGYYVYVSNRHFINKGSITSYKVQEDGTLKYIECYELEGKDPRGFNILNQKYLIVGLMDTNMVYIYELKEGRIVKQLDCKQIEGCSSFVLKKININSKKFNLDL